MRLKKMQPLSFYILYLVAFLVGVTGVLDFYSSGVSSSPTLAGIQRENTQDRWISSQCMSREGKATTCWASQSKYLLPFGGSS